MSKFEGCIQRITEELKGKLTSGEVRSIIEEVERRVFKNNRGQGVFDDLASTIEKEAQDLANSLARVKMLEKRNRILDVKRRVNRRNQLEKYLKSGLEPDKAMQAYNVGVESNIKEAAFSVDTRQRAQTARYLGGMLADLEREDLMPIFLQKDLDRQLARELYEVNSKTGKPGVSGSKEIQRVAEIVSKYQKIARDDMNRAGADIADLEHYITRQGHDVRKIRKSSQKEWKDFILSKLDHERTFGKADPDKYLDRVYVDLYTGHIARQDVPQSDNMAMFKGFRNVAKSVSHSRKLHFKDADAWYDYNEKFGSNRLRELVVSGMEMAAQQKVLMESWGTNPRANFEADLNYLAKKFKDNPEKLRRLTGLRSKGLEAQFNNIDGTARIAGSPTLAAIGQGWRVLESVSKLGGATISAIADIPIKASELEFQGMGYLEGYKNGFESILKGRGSKERKIISSTLGAGMDGMLGHIASRFSSTDNLPGRMARLQRIFFRMNFLTWWTDAQQIGIANAMSHNMALQRNTSFGKLNDSLKNVLGLYGIGDPEWKVYRKAVQKMDDGREYMTPDALEQIDDDVIRNYAGKLEMSDRDIKKMKDDLALRLQSYFTDRTDIGVLKQNARVQSITNLGLPPGTFGGEAIRFMMQFKSFPLTMAVRTWGRLLSGKGKADVVGLVHLAVMTTAFGYLAVAAKDVTKGQKPRDPKRLDTWKAAMIQGGAAHFLGDFLLNDWTKYGSSPVVGFAGPAASTAEDVGKFLNAVFTNWEEAPKTGFDLAKNTTPGINLFYLRFVLNYLFIYQLQEELSPGYLSRMQRRLKKNQGIEFFIKPSEAAR